MHRLLILTGASGSGKTAILDFCRANPLQTAGLHLLHFDSIGVPSQEEMAREFGSGENWQRAKTLAWIENIANRYLGERSVIFEGQMRIAFIAEALSRINLPEAKILLIDCTDSVRAHRLRELRQQPELHDQRMLDWAAYLRREAIAGGFEIIDTSEISLAAAAGLVLDKIKMKKPRGH